MFGRCNAMTTPMRPATTVVTRLIFSIPASDKFGRQKFLYKSLTKAVVIIYNTASAALISAEKMAAKANAAKPVGISSFVTIGRAMSEEGSDGKMANAQMPSKTGTMAKMNCTSALRAVPILTVRTLLAP